jgi:prevent-host-death family protein
MLIKSSSALRNDYDNLVKLTVEKNEPIYITRNGEGEMVFVSIEAYEKREAELKLLQKLLFAERNRLNGSPTHSTEKVRFELEEIYNE